MIFDDRQTGRIVDGESVLKKWGIGSEPINGIKMVGILSKETVKALEKL